MKNILKTALIILSAITVVACACEPCKATQKQARKVGVQMYTFHKYTFEDSIPMLKKVGVSNVGLTGGQKLSKKYPKKINPSLNAEERAYLKKLIADNGLTPVSYGVYYANDENAVKKACEFAKEMGIPMILTEAPANLLPAWEKYCGEYGIKMAIHNHAKDSKANNYYDPNVVKNLIKDYKNIYACPDNGHWSRSGIDAVKGYKILEGKIAILHFKDQKEFGNPKNQCVPFGTGALDMKAMLAELDRQNFDGYFLIEYEAKWEDNLADVAECVKYLRNN